jgi:excisionase family DNA binding protein
MERVKVIVTTEEELRAIVREELMAVVTNTDEQSEWMTAGEVASLLGYSRDYVSELVRRRGLPSHQPNGRGGRRMFKRSEVEEWAEKQRRSR